jgi:hypothetical protein
MQQLFMPAKADADEFVFVIALMMTKLTATQVD